jgi:formiminoglutamase
LRGHNNSYGNIKGSALAKGKPLTPLILMPILILESRGHSGNGFSYAYEEGFLKKYFVFGLHENYTSKSVLDIIKKQKIACDTPPMTVLKFVKKRL